VNDRLSLEPGCHWTGLWRNIQPDVSNQSLRSINPAQSVIAKLGFAPKRLPRAAIRQAAAGTGVAAGIASSVCALPTNWPPSKTSHSTSAFPTTTSALEKVQEQSFARTFNYYHNLTTRRRVSNPTREVNKNNAYQPRTLVTDSSAS
jgi:hypothetical protein